MHVFYCVFKGERERESDHYREINTEHEKEIISNRACMKWY